MATPEETVVCGYRVLITAGEDGWIIAEVPDLVGCTTQGATRAAALANVAIGALVDD